MNGDSKKFLSLSKINGGRVSFGDGKRGIITGVGKIGTSKLRALEDVYIVEGLKHNLLSISQLCDKGIDLTFLSIMENDPFLWHRRLVHASLKQLNILSSKDMVLGFPKTKFKEDKQKYVKEFLKRFPMEEAKEISTPIATAIKFDLDETGLDVEQKLYRGMIGSLLDAGIFKQFCLSCSKRLRYSPPTFHLLLFPP
ncbi:uncharacterized protein LOC124898024 [Capsicum annuum]|uniref:uncharacterized protein LOC124898024 n=1 Tax=Capsicum annuum TaxID=4072 RepID=UPI001FB04E7D|nr:uncharacterized protein LOC124898024 [Capsicum annuum]